MKFDFPYPPEGSSDTKERIDLITSWLFSLTENLNVLLNSLSEDNFAPHINAALHNIAERSNESDI